MASKKKCDHYWCYPSAVYAGDTENKVVVRRYCSKCKKEEHATSNRWRPSAVGEKKRFDHHAWDA